MLNNFALILFNIRLVNIENYLPNVKMEEFYMDFNFPS